MVDYAKKYKDRNVLIKNYRPLRFKFLGFRLTERLPHATTVPGPLIAAYLQLKILLGMSVTYFNVRSSMAPEYRKRCDMQFLTHFESEHVRDSQRESRGEKIHYYLIRLRYLPELSYINSVLYDPRSPKHPEQPKVDLYLLRWGYLLNVDPSFVELVHGTSRELAIDTLENLY